MKKVLFFVLFSVLLALGPPRPARAQDDDAPRVLRFRATSISERQANDAWGPDRSFTGVYVLNSAEDAFTFYGTSATLAYTLVTIKDVGRDDAGHKNYTLKLVDPRGRPATVLVKILDGDTRQLYFFANGRAELCVQVEVVD